MMNEMNRKLAIEYTTNVLKTLKKVKKQDPQLYKKIKVAIAQIREEPFVGESKKSDLKGVFSLDIRHTKTNYELAYMIKEKDKGEFIIVLMFGTRENFYIELKKYLN